MSYFDLYGVEEKSFDKVKSKIEQVFGVTLHEGGGWGMTVYRPKVDEKISIELVENYFTDDEGEQIYEEKYPQYDLVFWVNDVSENESNDFELQLTNEGFMTLISREDIK
ncbi:MAG: hypothetical protein MI976_14940 [Pseudomonadales bacterium]|nr:hypothetical protein [Pseudomonadales bacterium]